MPMRSISYYIAKQKNKGVNCFNSHLETSGLSDDHMMGINMIYLGILQSNYPLLSEDS